MIKVYRNIHNLIHRQTINAFIKGMPADYKIYDFSPKKYPELPEHGDTIIIFGIYKDITKDGQIAGNIIRAAHISNCLILERGFIKRDKYYMAGWGGLNNRANFKNESVGGDRWELLDIELKPPKHGGTHIIVAGQVLHDSSVAHIDFQQWVDYICGEIPKYTDKPIILRRHPQDKDIKVPAHVQFSTTKSYEEDLEMAHAVITFNSNLGVNAVLEGIPVYAEDEGSMVWSLAEKKLDNVDGWVISGRARENWAARISYTQWNYEEMRDGLPHKHLGVK